LFALPQLAPAFSKHRVASRRAKASKPMNHKKLQYSILACAIAALWVIGAGRILQMGVYVSVEGVLIRGLWRSRMLRWQEVENIRLHKATHRLGRWEIESGMTVLIERRDGSTVNTELWAQGVDFHSRPKVFRAVYHELRNRHLKAVNA